MDTVTVWKKSRFILSDRSDDHLINSLSRAFDGFDKRILASLSVDEMLLSMYVNCSTNFRGFLLEVEMELFCFIIIIIITIIMSCRSHGYPWPFLATFSYRSSPLAGLQGYIPYPHIAAIYMFELVVLLLLGHMRGSIEVHHLWARPCFSSSVLHVWFV